MSYERKPEIISRCILSVISAKSVAWNLKFVFTFVAVAKKKSSSTFFTKLKRIVLGLIIANVLFIVLTKWINTPITTVMISSIIKGNGLTRDYISYDEMGRNAKLAVICSEDQLFPDHNGFDVDAIKKAMKYNDDPKHKKTLGASTISQQTAKNVFLWNGRNWFRKGLEVYHTFMIELIWGKKRILETYLNVAEMGKGIFGIQAAAQFYFKKDAINLTKSEAAWIACILPNPAVWSVENPSASLVKKHNWILKQMNNLDDDSETIKVLSD
jgi:monofunctional biosynthetic peptidoglycan transglycosylase